PGPPPPRRKGEEGPTADNAVSGDVDRMRLGALPGGHQTRGLAVIHLALPGVMRQGIDVCNGLPVKHHANKLGSAPADTPPLRGIGVTPFAAIDHIALHLVGDVWSDLGGDGTGTAHRRAIANQRGSLLTFLCGNQIQAASLILLPPAPPITQGCDPLNDLLLGWN